MKVKDVVFKFEEQNDEFSFKEKINVLEDEKLIKVLGKENIKNEDSSLIMLSMNNLPVYDVIQLKINVAETGVFLVNFSKEEFTEEIRKEALQKIGELKDNITPTKETQINKIKKLLIILDKYKPIYVTYRSKQDIQIEVEDFNNISNETDFSFPIILLKNKKKKEHKKIHITIPNIFKKEKKEKVKKDKPVKAEVQKTPKAKKEKVKVEKAPKVRKEIVIDFPLFSFDYLWNTVFALSLGFSIPVAIYEVLNNDLISIALFAMAAIFIAIGYVSDYNTLYRKRVERYKGLKYWLLLYVLIGGAIGLAVGYVVAKFGLKTNNEINYSLILYISIPSSIVVSLAGIPASKLINLIIKKIKK